MHQRNIQTDWSSVLATAVAILSKAILPSNMVDTTKVLRYVPSYLDLITTPRETWRQAYPRKHSHLYQMRSKPGTQIQEQPGG